MGAADQESGQAAFGKRQYHQAGSEDPYNQKDITRYQKFHREKEPRNHFGYTDF